jgi:hypothetical protein
LLCIIFLIKSTKIELGFKQTLPAIFSLLYPFWYCFDLFFMYSSNILLLHEEFLFLSQFVIPSLTLTEKIINRIRNLFLIACEFLLLFSLFNCFITIQTKIETTLFRIYPLHTHHVSLTLVAFWFIMCIFSHHSFVLC